MSVTITISAEPNKGKTTIASLIEAALKEVGFVDVTVEDEPSTLAHKEPVRERFEAAKKRPVRIKVHNLGKQLHVAIDPNEYKSILETLQNSRAHLLTLGAPGDPVVGDRIKELNKAIDSFSRYEGLLP